MLIRRATIEDVDALLDFNVAFTAEGCDTVLHDNLSEEARRHYLTYCIPRKPPGCWRQVPACLPEVNSRRPPLRQPQVPRRRPFPAPPGPELPS
jgi:hypothetical protein